MPALPMPQMTPSLSPISALKMPETSTTSALVITVSTAPSLRLACDWRAEASGGGFDGGLGGGIAVLYALTGGGDEDESVAEGDAEEGDESDGGGDGEVLSGEVEGGDAADEGEWDVEEDEEAVAEGTEGGINHE